MGGFVYYNRGCYARNLAREFRVSALFSDGHVVRRRGDMSVFVNWGCGSRDFMRTLPYWAQHTVLNRAIGTSVKKMQTFAALDAATLPHPRIVTDPHEMIGERPFYIRGKYLGRQDGLTGGAGITIYEGDELPPANAVHDFFSQVVSKLYEVRIHVAGGNVICEQFKFVPPGSQTLIRNYDNGARFSAKALETHIDAENAIRARELAVAAIAAVGLDFGAVDMCLTRNGHWMIFETNSAPRLSEREDDDDHDVPSTYEAYRNYFRQFIR